MNLEIHKPELVQRVNAHIQTGQFQIDSVADGAVHHNSSDMILIERNREKMKKLIGAPFPWIRCSRCCSEFQFPPAPRPSLRIPPEEARITVPLMDSR
jgi:hypothetical protein